MATVTNTISTRPGLVRDLGASQAASIVVGVVIGSGIFLVPAEMMQAAGSARLVYLAWIVGGIFSFCGAVTYAQLGAMKPQAGACVAKTAQVPRKTAVPPRNAVK